MAISLPFQHIHRVVVEGEHTTSTTYETSPPPLARRAPVPLPHQSPDTPTTTHPIITYYAAGSFINWDVSCPPLLRTLGTILHENSSSRWTNEPAVEPQTLTSIVVRVVGVERPVVVFPRRGQPYITVIDVLDDVYSALRGAVVPFLARGVVGHNPYVLDVDTVAEAIRQRLRNRIWWGGLYQSANERDVYILHLNRVRGSGNRQEDWTTSSSRDERRFRRQLKVVVRALLQKEHVPSNVGVEPEGFALLSLPFVIQPVEHDTKPAINLNGVDVGIKKVVVLAKSVGIEDSICFQETS